MPDSNYEDNGSSQIGTAITFLIIGLGAGALLGVLLAPKTGRQMRKDLRRRYEDAKDSLQDWGEDAKGRLQDAVERGSDWADEVRANARDKARPLARALRRD